MTNERFKELLEELDGNSVKTLAEKNARYSADSGDALHNFKEGAEIAGGTPAQACWGYMTKHLVALRDKVERNDFSDKEDFLEKCQDTINYIRFLWCIGNEECMVEKRAVEEPEVRYIIRIFKRGDKVAEDTFMEDAEPSIYYEDEDIFVIDYICDIFGNHIRRIYNKFKHKYHIDKIYLNNN